MPQAGEVPIGHRRDGTEVTKLSACRYLLRVRGHLLDHGQNQLAITVVEAYGVAADLAEEADLVIGKLGQPFGSVAVTGFGEELRERKLHGPRDLGECVERRDGVAVLHPRKITAQQ